MTEAKPELVTELPPEYTDALTGFANRAWLNERLPDFIQERPGEIAVLFADLDGLKTENDTKGHGAGDALIIDAAHVIDGSIRHDNPERRGDMVGHLTRYGGDELIVVLHGVQTDKDLEVVKDRVQGRLEEVGIRTSVGGAVHDKKTGETSQELLKRADTAMLEDKENRKKASFESLPRRKQLAARFGARLLGYAGLNPPRQ